MITGSYSSNGTERCVHSQMAYHDQECRQCSPASLACHSSYPRLDNLMKFTPGCHSVSRSRANPNIACVSLTILLLLSLLLDLSLVSCLPIPGLDKQIENLSSTSQVSRQHHHHRHHRHRERAKQHYHLESIEILDTSASLSIVTPLDVLRQNMILEIHRKRLRDAKSKQVKFNTEFLERIG